MNFRKFRRNIFGSGAVEKSERAENWTWPEYIAAPNSQTGGAVDHVVPHAAIVLPRRRVGRKRHHRLPGGNGSHIFPGRAGLGAALEQYDLTGSRRIFSMALRAERRIVRANGSSTIGAPRVSRIAPVNPE